MRKVFARLICVFFLINALFITEPLAAPNTVAEGVVLLDAKSGEILYSKEANTRFEPASTTKVITALVTLENSNLNDVVKIGKNPPLTEGSSIGIQEGETYTVKELLLGLLLESGNDCAVALAEYISGSSEEFAKLMNAKAKELGANNSNFENPSGLHGKNHYTTPYDLALIMKEAANNETFVEIATTENYFYKNHPNSDGTEKWAANRNHCLNEYSEYYYENLLAGKTGYTPEANHTYTAAAKKGDQILIASFLNAKDKDKHYRSVGQLFDYGFNNFDTIKLASKGEELLRLDINKSTTIPLLAAEDVYATVKKGERDLSTKEVVILDEKDISKESIKEGDILFKGAILLNNEEVANVNLVSGVDREYTFRVIIDESVSNLSTNKVALVIIVIVAFLIIAILFFNIKSAIKKRRLKRKYRHLKFK